MGFVVFKLITSYHCVKIARIWSFSGPYFPAFGPSEGKYGPEKIQIWILFMQWI